MGSRAENLTQLYDGLRAADTVVAKTLGVDEQAQTAQIESRLRSFITAHWRDLAIQATKTAAGRIGRGRGNVVQAGDVDRALAAVDGTMDQWAGRVTSRFVSDLREAYKLSRTSGMNKALGIDRKELSYDTRTFGTGAKVEKAARKVLTTLEPSFDLVDEHALDALQEHQVFWIGQHYKDNVAPTIAKAAREQITVGMGRAEAGRVMEGLVKDGLENIRVPGGFRGTSRQYFEGLAANATTVARATGHVRSFEKVGYTTYVIVNPSDHRTCEICNLLDGKEFKTTDGTALSGRVLSVSKPNQVKKVQPFLTVNSATKLTGGKAGPAGVSATRGLAARGNSLPPFHYRCRCDIDITREAEIIPFEKVPDVKPVGGKLVAPNKKVYTHKPAIPKPLTKPESLAVREVPFDAKVAEQYADQFIDEWQKSPGKIRKPIREFLEKEYGITRGQAGKLGKLTVGSIDQNMYGVHRWDMSVEIREDVAETVLPTLAEISTRRQGLKEFQKRGFSTVLHEELHGTSKFTARAYRAGGAVVEEVTVELTTRRVLRDLYGDVAKKVGGASPDLHQPSISPLTRKWATRGSYRTDIEKMLNMMSKHTKWKPDKVVDNVERAGILMRGKAGPKFNRQSPKKHVESFVDALPDLTDLSKKERKALEKGLNSMVLERFKGRG